jgi:hypothetical protein
MTTLEFAYFVCNKGDQPCFEGIEFAKQYPDLMDSIDKLLAGVDDPQFIRWACWQSKILGNKYTDFTDAYAIKWREKRHGDYIHSLNNECANILRKYIRDNNLV